MCGEFTYDRKYESSLLAIDRGVFHLNTQINAKCHCCLFTDRFDHVVEDNQFTAVRIDPGVTLTPVYDVTASP